MGWGKLLGWIVLGLLGLGSAGGIIAFACLKGKKVAFIGMTGSGKTTAVHAFQAIERKNTNWKASVDTPTTMDSEEKEINVLGFTACIDTSGDQELKKSWENTVKKADWIFYFFDISKLNDVINVGGNKTRYCTLVKADLRDIAGMCGDKGILVLATHTDLAYDRETADRQCGKILEELSQREYKFVKGSLKDYASALKLKEEIGEKLK